ncbi:MAG: lysine--tRNA ligase [Candidatus Portnoybacteria bacterium RIFCSPLOWO2_12_FULL_39_9]|uniref:Lysine--tRNA ligase n=1 Tax=Candidatus Portnoybacteria bacterium RIFCSPHIGHO2_12_FULL_38_9 TaxID=1801997 RepID=A0A1G2FE17_9BACT|nr:MAG: lysine--tRNA ligase [Candidatus Portnoybacteria bacterium RBG_13_40_8]OGZ35653.1 MAG: lysine--tRNA ligase [Candidatus Portnoybacteria bacterium RIFCSPHIGHO2_02_FULL_39_12]OGZ36306.1 MAG: lysine--tRNA ligase [Candidatus Portnoybacteria bacterium RIFCSPHIGHO2_12_FULL_38_9]OGZ37854.1 MAG: lysine--tRNA ligase [Candidatus Portnoybacteria bacterium RIFCSPLOWO2_01_FULL_38_39]OGZ40770.1 MAG: lysine--tRNA ligase [Candidatus Portnoybacteria bacterium RIFCSPLOWO2_12_FULL_39_9]
MSSLQSIKKIRLKKLGNIRRAGINPYPAKTRRTHTCQKALDDFEGLLKQKSRLILVGRIKSIREHGGSAFAHIEDGASQCQIYFKQDQLGQKKYKFFLNNLEVGDFIEAEGEFFLTKKGEKTLLVKDFRILAKAILPLPEKWHGLKDVEERFRKRYLDLLMNREVRERFVERSGIIRIIREFLDANGFIEVETPILQIIPGGASARPFKTHLNALDLDLYLRVAPELFLKRLLVGGFEKVYEIGRCFRNEGIDFSHNPDFTMLEFYWAYADYEDLMEMTERMFGYIIQRTANSEQRTIINYQGHQINFKTPWPKKTMKELLLKESKIDIDKIKKEELFERLKKIGVKAEKTMPKCKLIDELYKKTVRPKLIQPCFVINHPIEMTPLAKSIEGDLTKAARFQLVIGGLELVNAFSELNDPLEQDRRFKEQEGHRKAGEDEAQRQDKDFVEALEYGLPPAAGFGLGLDRLAAFLTDSHSLREIILFPLMRPK